MVTKRTGVIIYLKKENMAWIILIIVTVYLGITRYLHLKH